MVTFSFKKAKQISYCCGSLILLSLTSAKGPSQDISLLKRAREHWQEGDFSLAKRQIRTYLEKHPEGDLREELHLLLGDLYLQEGNFSAALEEYQIIQKPELSEKIFYNKALCLYETKKSEELLILVDTIHEQKNLSDEQIHSLRYLSALSLFTSQKEQNFKNKDLLEKATSLFESCKKTEFSSQSLPFLANLYLLNGEKQKAASCYLSLAQEDPSQAPDLLFEAALLIAEKNSDQALKLFRKILTLNSSKKSSAAYNCMILQYQEKQFKDVVLTYEENVNLFNSSQKANVSYLLGKSLYALNDFKNASQHLLIGLEDNEISSADKKNTYFMILECAYKTQNIDLYKETLEKTLVLSDTNTDNEKAQIAYLDLLKLYERRDDLIKETQSFLGKYPEYSGKENLLLNLTQALYESKNWKQAEETISFLLEQYPNTATTSRLLRLQINCAAAQVKESSEEALSIHRAHWTDVLQTALQTPNLLTSSEKEIYLFELTKNLFLQGNHKESLEFAEELLSEFPNTTQKKDLELIRALCYLKDPDSKLLFALHTEKLIRQHPEMLEACSLRMHLFNIYLQLANESSLDPKEEFLTKAADLLYVIFETKEQPILQENLQWLANYYYKSSKSNSDIYLNRAYALFETILSDNDLTSDKKELLESNLFKFCKILDSSSKFEKKVALLDRWVNATPFTQSGLQKHLIFELAKTHALLGNQKKALELYDILIRCSFGSQIGSESLFESSKILFSNLKEDEKIEENESYITVLGHFKNVEIQRNLQTEPLHLESGLEYIQCKTASFKDLSTKNQKTVELLLLFKQNFKSAPGYEKKNLQDKSETLDAYMKFADAELFRYESYLEKNETKARDLMTKSKLLSTELLDNSNTPSQLKKRIEAIHQELKD